MASTNESDKKISFKDSLNLPHTEFPIRANSKIEDSILLNRWEKEDLYSQSFNHNKGNVRFIFHDGPPYANGHIHLGGAYNKILKDIACKSRRMFGMHVPVTPGWDCHGLPVELKVVQEQPSLTREQLIGACRTYAQHWIAVQREEFKKLGILMDFSHPYLTMNFSYEAKELRILGDFVEKGYIERSNKTVHWCASCQTVLATAEIEYENRKDPSIYVLFTLQAQDAKKLFSMHSTPISVVIWTTTPWTLPLNRAVLAKPDTSYALLEVDNHYLLLGKERVDSLLKLLGKTGHIIAEIGSDHLENLSVQHPFLDRYVPIILDQHVATNEGTALVHCAPGAGHDDYEIGIKNNLEIYSPVGANGTYTKDIQPAELAGMSVKDGQLWVLKKLQGDGKLLHHTSITHSYPHCWRCHQGLIFRATKQWFFNLTDDRLKERVLQATQLIATLPENSINRLQATIEGRLEWCISRQRTWGVPIPALICTACDQTYISRSFIESVAQGVENEGIEFWHHASISSLVPENFACLSCNAQSFKKELDILDVWFDSGVSHHVVLANNPELGFPADLYLEGKDQHRGWFQSSLLTSVAISGTAPTKMIITHGFTVDAEGHKMSKSLGNVVAPQEIVDMLGTDGLRLWAASIDFSSEVVVSDVLLRNVQEVFRKVRNTCRFLLANLYDFDLQTKAIPLHDMRVIDQYALQELFEFNYTVLDAYRRYDFTAISHALGDYCSVNLSTVYFEIVKDCLYVEKADGHARRSVQTACWYILDTLVRLIAPICSFAAEQISDHYQTDKKNSIHLQHFTLLKDLWPLIAENNKKLGTLLQYDRSSNQRPYDLLAMVDKIRDHTFTASQKSLWNGLKAIRSTILKETETLREQNIIKRSLDAKVSMYIEPCDETKYLNLFFDELLKRGESVEQFFKDFAILSQFSLVDSTQGMTLSTHRGIYLQATKAMGEKCPRCWQWSQTTHEHNLCVRCYAIVKSI